MTYQLHHGDCLDYLKSLPDGSVDAVVTDPPYGEGQAAWDGIKPPDELWDEIYRVTAVGGVLYYFGFWGHAEWVLSNARRVGFAALSELVWWFRTGRPQRFNYRQDAERAWYLSKGDPRTFNADAVLEPYENSANYKRYGRDGKHPGTVWIASRIFHNHPENVGHETQKPLSIIEKMVRVSTNEGCTVLDPFMGSGTTGVACMNTGRNFIGCEIDAGYFAIAERRIREAKEAVESTLFAVA